MCLHVQMASQPIGECLVKEIPRAAAASDAPSKLYRFINSSGNYATVMAIVRLDFFIAHCSQASMQSWLVA